MKYKDTYYHYTRKNICMGERAVRLYRSKDLMEFNDQYIVLKLPYNVYICNIFSHNDTIHAFFFAYNLPKNHIKNTILKPYDIGRIVYATSTDGINFTTQNDNVFDRKNIFPVNGYINENNNILVFFNDYEHNMIFMIKLASINK